MWYGGEVNGKRSLLFAAALLAGGLLGALGLAAWVIGQDFLRAALATRPVVLPKISANPIHSGQILLNQF